MVYPYCQRCSARTSRTPLLDKAGPLCSVRQNGGDNNTPLTLSVGMLAFHFIWRGIVLPQTEARSLVRANGLPLTEGRGFALGSEVSSPYKGNALP
ncbi:hypothetical protein PG630_04600 [Riemerella anatipestifer]|nr:hypothetical protein [Riemerella anatipestifer]